MGCPTLGSLVQGHGEERPLALMKYYQLCGQLRNPQLWVVHALLGRPEPWDRICIVGYQGLRGPASQMDLVPMRISHGPATQATRRLPLSLPGFRYEGMLFVFSA